MATPKKAQKKATKKPAKKPAGTKSSEQPVSQPIAQTSSEAIIPLDIDTKSLCLMQDNYKDLNLSPEAQVILKGIVSSTHVGLVSAAPIICSGPGNCPFISRCPIQRAGGTNFPLQKQCIAEAAIIQERFIAYADEVSKGNPNALDSATFRAQVSKLVELDLYDYRLSLILAGVAGDSDGSLLLDQTIAVSDTGEEIQQLVEHPAWKMKEKVNRQRMELLDAMGLTIRRKAAIDAALHRVTTETFMSKSIELLEKLYFLEEAVGKD